MDLVPLALIITRYLLSDQVKTDELATAAEEASRSVEEYIEQNAAEDGPLAEVMEDGRVNKALIATRLSQIRRGIPDPDEVEALKHLLKLNDTETRARRAVKEAQAALSLAALGQYGQLTKVDVEDLVLDSKWRTELARRIIGEIESLVFGLVSRLRQLGERYEKTVADLDAELRMLHAAVDDHLAAMGVKA